MSQSVEWSDLPEELVDVIASRLFSKVELLRVRSICKTWRSAASIHKRYPKRHNRNRVRVLSPLSEARPCSLSPAAFSRVFLSSCRSKGWLIKTQDDAVSETRKKLLHPLSRATVESSHKTLDLLEYTVSEIHQSYDVHNYYGKNQYISCNFARVVLLGSFVFGVNNKKEIWWCNNEEIKYNNVWTRVSDEDAEYFSDIIVHKGQIYALDLNSAIWWISLSELKIYQYGPSTPMDYYEVDNCKEKRLVEYCGELCIIHRFCKKFRVRRYDVERTVGFKVYKMDMELVEWVEVKSLGDKAFVMATDCCFSVVAGDYYGCLESAIYFTEKKDVNVFKLTEEKGVNVFKLGDGSVTKLVKPSSKSCFHMFYPPFV